MTIGRIARYTMKVDSLWAIAWREIKWDFEVIMLEVFGRRIDL